MKKLLFIIAIISSFSGFAQDKQTPDNEKLNEMLSAMGMSGQVAPEYNFPMSVDMTMTNYEKGKPSKPMQMTVYINNDKGLFATRMADDKGKNPMLMIVDQENNSIVMLNEKEKTAMAVNTKVFMATNDYKGMNDKAGTVDCKKTGKTKTIAGYPCEEYICTNTERNGRYEIYVTNEVKFDFTNNDGRNNPFAEYFKQAARLGGMMTEGKFYENDVLQATLTVSSINEKAAYKIKTAGYKTGM